MKFRILLLQGFPVGPSPHGEGGLKYKGLKTTIVLRGPSPCGEGGLKLENGLSGLRVHGPSPHGEGGLKLPHPQRGQCAAESLPPRGGWIEIFLRFSQGSSVSVPPPTGRGDWNSFIPFNWNHSLCPPPFTGSPIQYKIITTQETNSGNQPPPWPQEGAHNVI